MEKTDLTKHFKSYYSAKTKPELITIAAANFISIKGKGDPSGKEYAHNLEALYSVAYTLKFIYKALNKDFVVAKLEGLWSFDEKHYKDIPMTEAPQRIPRSEWNYRMLIRLPGFVEQEKLLNAIRTTFEKKEILLAKNVEWFEMKEGKCVQMLHLGPFDKEPETLLRMQEFIQQHKFEKNGMHHEIYLSDFRKTSPAKLKTILREPVK